MEKIGDGNGEKVKSDRTASKIFVKIKNDQRKGVAEEIQRISKSNERQVERWLGRAVWSYARSAATVVNHRRLSKAESNADGKSSIEVKLFISNFPNAAAQGVFIRKEIIDGNDR